MAAEVYFEPCNLFLWNTGPAQGSMRARKASSPFSQIPHEGKSEGSVRDFSPKCSQEKEAV
jgi:hypothetical protein